MVWCVATRVGTNIQRHDIGGQSEVKQMESSTQGSATGSLKRLGASDLDNIQIFRDLGELLQPWDTRRTLG